MDSFDADPKKEKEGGKGKGKEKRGISMFLETGKVKENVLFSAAKEKENVLFVDPEAKLEREQEKEEKEEGVCTYITDCLLTKPFCQAPPVRLLFLT